MPEDLWRHPTLVQAVADLDLARVVRLLREHTGLTQEQLGLLMGMRHHRVSELENGRRQVWNIRVLKRALAGLGAPPLASDAPPHYEPHDNSPGQAFLPSAEQQSGHDSEPFPGWPPSIAEALQHATELWNADGSRLPRVVGDQATTIALRWLVAPSETAVTRSGGGRVGRNDVERVHTLGRQLKALDNSYGGGSALPLLTTFLRNEVVPLLQGSYTEPVGTALIRAAAELTLDAGWAAYDVGQHHLARAHMAYALRLSHAAHDRLFGARILAAMSHQALHLNQVPLAIDLVRAAQTGTGNTAHPTITAMLAAMEACAHAARADRRPSLDALSAAEGALEAASNSDPPTWLDFDEGALWGHAARVFRELGDPAESQRYATEAVVVCRADHGRTCAQRNAILASAYVQQGEIEQAVDVGTGILNQAQLLRSRHVDEEITTLARAIQATGAATTHDATVFLNRAHAVVSSGGASAATG